MWQPLRAVRAGDDGTLVDSSALAPATAEVTAFAREQGLQLFRMDRTLGSETLSRRSEPMRKMAGAPMALLSPADAERLKITSRVSHAVDGSTVELAAGSGQTCPDVVAATVEGLRRARPRGCRARVLGLR